MFSLMFDVVNQNKRRMEIIQMLTEIMNFLGITVFNELFDAGNFSKQGNFEQPAEPQRVSAPQVQKQT